MNAYIYSIRFNSTALAPAFVTMSFNVSAFVHSSASQVTSFSVTKKYNHINFPYFFSTLHKLITVT